VDLLFIPIFASVILIVGGPLFIVPLTLFATFGYLAVRRTAKLKEMITEREQTDARKNDFVIEALEAMPTVKSFSMEPLMMRRFERLQLTVSDVVRRTILLTNAAQTYASLYASISAAAIVGFGAILVIDGRLTMGGLACCMLLSSQLLQPLMRILTAWNEVHLANHRRERVAELFDIAKEDDEQDDEIDTDASHESAALPISFPPRSGPAQISLKKMSIQHEGYDPLFENLNLKIEKGAFVAFKGEDGSGRSTLLHSLTGVNIPKEGSLFFGDLPLNKHTQETIRQRVRYVSQSPDIFRGTLLENLNVFGRISADDCLQAAKLIGLHDEVSRMPQGYDTMIEKIGRA
ncbi:MAG: ATP-binding cassette domain-containing protein, partial [Pseudomonadota bacterium]